MFFELSYIPRAMNHLANSLAISASLFVPPLPARLSYDIQVKYRSSLPDNVKFWKVFENDDELSKFLQVVGEFYDMHIDQENLNMEEYKKLKLKYKVHDQNIVQYPWKSYLIIMMSLLNLPKRRKILLSKRKT